MSEKREEHEDIQLRSDEVQEILGTPPKWIVRWGTVIVLLVLLAMLALSYFFESTDKVGAEILVTTPSPPMPITATLDGHLDKIFVEDKQIVKRGDLLMTLGGEDGRYSDILALEAELKQLQQAPGVRNSFFKKDDGLQLGTLGIPYMEFLKDYNNYRSRTNSGLNKKQVEQLQALIRAQRKVVEDAERKRQLLDRQLYECPARKKRYWEGYQINIFTYQDYRRIVTTCDGLPAKVETQKEKVEEAKIRIETYEKEKLDIQRGTVSGINSRLLQLQGSINALLAGIEEWKDKYLVTSPVDGKVSFYTEYNEGQIVSEGENILAIVAEKKEIVGRIELPTKGSGKVKVGQEVNIKLFDYPSSEFGIVKGEVESISHLPIDHKYVVDVALPKGLLTTFGKELKFKQELPGIAEIKTESRRFIERIFDRFVHLFKADKKQEG